MERVRVLLAEDEGLLRTTLAELLGREPDLEIVGASANGREGLADALRHHPHVLLTDLRMPHLDGLELIRALRAQAPEIAIVVLTAFDDDEDLFAALKAGALGYVLKDARKEQIVEAIHAARRGEGFLAPGLVRRVLEEFRRVDRMVRAQRELYKELTRREMDVLKELAGGKSNRQIAGRLFLSEKTVRNYISAILQKLHANDRTEAAQIASRHGLGPEEPAPGDPRGVRS